ncbi:MAG TPA: DNA polymerase III subunit alpha [Verrucomicrobia bacterium]|jgi:DNA polymerase-3 subunit alpha|nr:DNA polymerase III subunit alpha [Verrucomicrobiota bacterium]
MVHTPSFVHLHNHSHYSLLDGHSRIEALVKTAQEMGMPAVALTDHGNMFGVVELYQECKKASAKAAENGLKPIKAIVGMEAFIAPEGKSMRTREKVDGEYGRHLLILAKNYQGYKNLMKLSSKAYLHGFYYRPRIDKDLLAQHSEGLILTSTDIGGEIPRLLLKGKTKEAYHLAGKYMDIVGKENFYFELQDHGLQEERLANPQIIEMAKEFGRPCVATNDIHYVHRADSKAHDILLCVQTGKKRADTNRLKFTNDQFYMKSPEEMAMVFRDFCPEALQTTLEIAERCDLEIPLGEYHFPYFPLPEGQDEESYFRELVYQGLHKRFGDPLTSEICARAEEELRVICKMGFVGYLLIVWDLIRHAREVGIPVGPGRGSAAGSIVTYALEITNLNPLQYDLLFERFINEGRNEMPDIDIDFCQARRTEMIEYAAQRYGQANVCQIITFGTFAAKGSIRDVGRVLDVPLPEVDRIAKTVPAVPGIKLIDALEESPDFRTIYNSNPVYRELIDVAMSIEGLVRHTGTHAAGVIIADRDVTEYAPLYKAPSEEMPCTQYDMKLIDPIGLLKVDFLGLQTLTVIQRAAELVQETTGEDLRMDQISFEDPEVYQVFSRGDTNGVFQFESDGMKKMLRQARPDRLEDLIALNAMYRPGPMGNISSFIRRKHGQEEVIYQHPDLEPILGSTYGVIVYQEQVMLLASKLAGFSLSEADKLRKAMGKKKKDIMAEYRALFLKGAKDRGYSDAIAIEVYDLIEKFAEYGFNKSHSAAYAYLAYQTAFLKAKYPTQFMAAVLTLDMGNTDKVAEYIEESKRMGLEVRGPDVNESGVGFAVPRDGEIRYALAAIKGVGARAMEELVRERQANGPYAGIFDLCERFDSKVINKTTLQNLIKAGAFDSFGTRSQHFAVAEKALAIGAARNRDRVVGQGTLFDLFGAAAEEEGTDSESPHELPPIPEWDSARLSEEEKEVLGFYFSHHPLDAYRGIVTQLSSHSMQTLTAVDEDGNPLLSETTGVTIGGLISAMKRTFTQKQQQMGIVQMQGLGNSICEAVAFPQTYEQYQEHLATERMVFLQGVVRLGLQGPSLVIDRVIPMEEARSKLVDYTLIDLTRVPDDKLRSVLEQIRSVCSINPGTSLLLLRLRTTEGAVAVVQGGDQYRITACEELEQLLNDLVGPGSITLVPRSYDPPPQKRNGRRNYPPRGSAVAVDSTPNQGG